MRMLYLHRNFTGVNFLSISKECLNILIPTKYKCSYLSLYSVTFLLAVGVGDVATYIVALTQIVATISSGIHAHIVALTHILSSTCDVTMHASKA